jgi:hypothetical protein
MSKTWEHDHHAARHQERAAYHYKPAAKYDEAEEHEKAAHHAYLADGHNQHAIHHDAEAAKLHAEQCATTWPCLLQSKKAIRRAPLKIGHFGVHTRHIFGSWLETWLA